MSNHVSNTEQVPFGPNPAVNTDAPRRGLAGLVRAGYLTR